MGARLGVFGGTFDPPHVGHLLAASDAFEQLDLDRVLFVPAGAQPFKLDDVHATSEQRLRMVELTIDADSRFAADRVEIDRAGLSYTVDTLAALAARDSDARRFLLIGEDLASQIETWRESSRIAELAEVVVLSRVADSSAPAGGSPQLRRIATRRIDISSTEIRARVRSRKSIHGFVTAAVADYIGSVGLYR